MLNKEKQYLLAKINRRLESIQRITKNRITEYKLTDGFNFTFIDSIIDINNYLEDIKTAQVRISLL